MKRSDRSKLVWLLGGLFGMLGVTAAAAQPLPAGRTMNLNLMHNGIEREFDIYVPQAAADGSPRPLILDLHGFTGSGNQQRLTSGWEDLAAAEALIVAWPDGEGGEWSIGGALGAGDDVGFLTELVDEIARRTAVDRASVHATGFSMGGDMVRRLACDAPDRFGAFMAVASSTRPDFFTPESCSPLRPPPMLSVRGRTDSIIPFNGGMANLAPISTLTFEVRSAAAELEFWRNEAQCSGAQPDRIQSPGPTTECRAYTQCGGNAEVESCFVNSDAFSGHDLYANNDGVDLAARGWSFMQSHPIPEEFLPSESDFEITADVEGNWFDPGVGGQGLMFDRVQGSDQLFVAWFTYTADVVAPILPLPDIGAAGQRWLVGSRIVDGNTAAGELVAPAGGAFLQPEGEDQAVIPAGFMEIEFFGCDRAEVRYVIDAFDLAGSFPIEPLAKIVLPTTFECSPRAPAEE
jgi:polyhydroxybutyrate depolymerase